METKSTVARHTIAGCRIPKNIGIRLIGKAGFNKIDICRLDPQVCVPLLS
jgi:hypothetical protein